MDYVINERAYTYFSSTNEELSFSSCHNYVFDLSYLSTLRLQGHNAREFLQGQVTCDMRDVSPRVVRQGALCNLQGRILALAEILQWDDFYLVLPSDLLAQTGAILQKTALFSKVLLSSEQPFKLLGFYLKNKEDLLPSLLLPDIDFTATSTDSSFCFRLSPHLYFILTRSDVADNITTTFKQKNQWRGSLAWHFLCLQRTLFEIYPATYGQFLPHRLNLHLKPTLSFDKGCYKGQEIIARTHYRATLKHELKLFEIIASSIPIIGQRLLCPMAHGEVGELVDVSPLSHPSRYLIAASVLKDHPQEVLLENSSEKIMLVQYPVDEM